MNERTKVYREFFMMSPEGQEFIAKLKSLIDQNHESAENNPELARDYTQRAKGVREAIQCINSLTTEAKKERIQ